MCTESELFTEHGVLTVSENEWELARLRSKIIAPLAKLETISWKLADNAANKLKISRRQVYSLIKQYHKLFVIENVDIKFEHEALLVIVKKSITRKSGARALRSILEDSLLDLMYEVPSLKNIKEIIITEGVINKTSKPILIYNDK